MISKKSSGSSGELDRTTRNADELRGSPLQAAVGAALMARLSSALEARQDLIAKFCIKIARHRCDDRSKTLITKLIIELSRQNEWQRVPAKVG